MLRGKLHILLFQLPSAKVGSLKEALSEFKALPGKGRTYKKYPIPTVEG